MTYDQWMCQPIGYDLRQFREELRDWPDDDMWRAARELKEREQSRVKLRLVRAEMRYRTPPRAVRVLAGPWMTEDLYWQVDGESCQIREITNVDEHGNDRSRKVWACDDPRRLAHVARWLRDCGWDNACRELSRAMPGMAEYLEEG